MTRAETTQLMSLIFLTYKTETSPSAVELWYELLKGYPFEQAREALLDCLTKLSFEPRPADVIRGIKAISRKRLNLPSGEAAWKAVMRQNIYYPSTLPAPVLQALRTVGSLRDVLSSSAVEQNEKKFLFAYNNLLDELSTEKIKKLPGERRKKPGPC